MAKTRYYYLQGKTKWFRHQTTNEWGKWSHVLYPDKESLETIRDLQSEGLKNVLKKDEDGYYLTIGRNSQKMIKGKVVGFAPPEVFEADGVTPMKNVPIGNGSDITTKIEVYDFKVPGQGGSGIAARWMSSKIDNLVPFKSQRDFTIDEEHAARGLDEQKPNWQ